MDILAARKKAAERAKSDRAEKPQVAATAAQDALVPALRQEAVQPGPEGTAAAEPVVPVRAEPSEPATAESAEPALQPDDAATVESAADERDLEMLSVLLGQEEYAVPVDRVREVLTPREITPVPHTPGYILGVCSLRGAVLPIIDLKQRLGLAEAERNEKTRIVVAGVEDDDRIGLLVDRVRGVIRFPAAAVRPVPETVEQGAEFLSGIVRQDDRLIILLDVYKTTAP